MQLSPRQIASSAFRFIRQNRAGLIISSFICVVSLVLYVPVYLQPRSSPLLRFLADIELKTLDTRFLLRGRRLPDPDIVIVAIDQKSEDVLGRWPFPRNDLAQALNDLNEGGARTVAFDINFPQPDQNSALRALQDVKSDYQRLAKSSNKDSRQFDARLNALLKSSDNDRQFATALAHYPNAVLGYFFLTRMGPGARNQQRVKDFVNYLSFQAYPQVSFSPPQPGLSGARLMGRCVTLFRLWDGPEFPELSPNLPSFANYAKNFGYFNILPDADGTVRREPVIALYDGNFYPSLDVAAAMTYLNVPLNQVSPVFTPGGLHSIDLGKRIVIPTHPDGSVLIDYRGPSRTYPTYSLADLLQGRVPLRDFRNKLVLIGPTAVGIGDMAVTPFQRMDFPGVEVHANFIDDILNGRFIRRGLQENLIDILFLVLFSLGAGILLSVVPPVRATTILLVTLGLFLWLAYYLFVADRIWIAVFLPMAALTTNYASIISYRFFFEEREKKKVRGAFQQYLPPGLISQLLEHPELLRLGGEEKELSIMFSDIRGFTALSEGLSPQALVELLNEYLSAMTDVIFSHWGTLDKYIGDAIMAFWGAPYPQADHAERSCRAALDMVRALHALRERWAQRDLPLIDFGVGINTGPVLVGNMGSKRRFNFTIMGDNVNLASRLEGINKQFGTRIILSQYLYQRVQGAFVTRELDLIRVKGKTTPVKIYELMGSLQEKPRFEDLATRFEKGLAAYRDGRWEEAVGIFNDLLKDYPRDGPTRVLAKRCQDLLDHPPDGAWDGVYVMKTK
jgi:adenylate cyclase